jgi:hypothetical protein
MPRTPDPAQMAKNWQAGMAQGAGKYKAGVQNFQGNPMALAAAKVADGTYLAAVQEAVSSGRMVARLNAVDPGFWKSQASGAGAAAWAAGSAKGLPKYMRAVQSLAPAYARASADAAAATGPLAKVAAAINALRAAVGKPPIA